MARRSRTVLKFDRADLHGAKLLCDRLGRIELEQHARQEDHHGA